MKRIGFLGFGKSNKALFEFLTKNFSFEAVIRDESVNFENAPKSAKLLLGKNAFDAPVEDVIFLSPSARRERPEIQKLAKGGARLSSDAELFFSEKPKNVIAVTGSDGKSTTTALCSEILNAGGKSAVACGNFGVPLTPLFEEHYDYFVTELSSFTLNYLAPPSKRALITNITPNHLNWHAGFDEYALAKENVLKNAEERVFSYDCPHSRALAEKYGAYALFSTKTPYSELKKAFAAKVFLTLEGGRILKNGEPIIERRSLKILGIHNVKNALAAMCLTDGICENEAAIEVLSSFTGLEHRCKLVYDDGNMRYYDSSIDSTPERTRATLAVFDSPVCVILGGKDKGLDYAPLEGALKAHASYVILCGENETRLADFIRRTEIRVPFFFAADYGKAVKMARALGCDTVLSPASTSYDRFSNFEERGRAFLQAILNEYK